MSKLRRSVLTCTVEDEQNRKYGLTAGHVTQASDGNILLKNGDKFGECVPHFRQLTVDVGLFNICRNFYRNCENKVYDPDGKERFCKLYTGCLSDLYGKQVFKCVPPRRVTDKHEQTGVVGMVASQTTHQVHRHIIGDDTILVALLNQDERFAVEGESGSPLCLDIGDTDVYLVGSITGLFDQRYIVCAYLPHALKRLAKEKNRKLHISPPIEKHNQVNSACATAVAVCKARDCIGGNAHNTGSASESILTHRRIPETIFFGRDIFFKSVEQVSKTDFEIDERLCILMCLKFELDNNSTVTTIEQSEQSFRKMVFTRDPIDDNAVFVSDRAEQRTLFYFYLTVQCLYAQDLKKAKVLLTEALRCLDTVRESQLRLVCKCITYTTWYYLSTGESNCLDKVLSAGLEFYYSYKGEPYFPTECLGYHYYDYSRHYVVLGDQKEAIGMAEKGHQYLTQTLSKADQSNIDSFNDAHNRYIFGVCQFAQSLLWCGEHFEYAETNIHNENMTQARSILNPVFARMREAPNVQKANVLLAECDLLYRESNYPDALKKATTCIKLSKKHDLHEEQGMAGSRIVFLKKLLKK